MTELLLPEQIQRAASLLKENEIIAFPTETVYGLGARLFSSEALQKIYAAKQRPPDNPLIVHIASIKEVERIARDIPPLFYPLAEAFFPGPLTLILKRAANVPDLVSAGLDTIAIRMPSHPIAQALIERVGEPVAAPSANLSGRPSSTSAQHVLEDFTGMIAAVIDGGPSQLGIESTVVSLVSGDRPLLLRPGVITKYALENVCGKVEERRDREDVILSPGTRYRHYAPKTPMLLLYSEQELLAYLTLAPAKKRLLLAHRAPSHPMGVEFCALNIQNFYSSLRLADREEYEEILVLWDTDLEGEVALKNRLWLSIGKK